MHIIDRLNEFFRKEGFELEYNVEKSFIHSNPNECYYEFSGIINDILIEIRHYPDWASIVWINGPENESQRSRFGTLDEITKFIKECL